MKTTNSSTNSPASAAAALLGSAKSPAKAASSRQNGRKGGRPNVIAAARARLAGSNVEIRRWRSTARFADANWLVLVRRRRSPQTMHDGTVWDGTEWVGHYRTSAEAAKAALEAAGH